MLFKKSNYYLATINHYSQLTINLIIASNLKKYWYIKISNQHLLGCEYSTKI